MVLRPRPSDTAPVIKLPRKVPTPAAPMMAPIWPMVTPCTLVRNRAENPVKIQSQAMTGMLTTVEMSTFLNFRTSTALTFSPSSSSTSTFLPALRAARASCMEGASRMKPQRIRARIAPGMDRV